MLQPLILGNRYYASQIIDAEADCIQFVQRYQDLNGGNSIAVSADYCQSGQTRVFYRRNSAGNFLAGYVLSPGNSRVLSTIPQSERESVAETLSKYKTVWEVACFWLYFRGLENARHVRMLQSYALFWMGIDTIYLSLKFRVDAFAGSTYRKNFQSRFSGVFQQIHVSKTIRGKQRCIYILKTEVQRLGVLFVLVKCYQALQAMMAKGDSREQQESLSGDFD